MSPSPHLRDSYEFSPNIIDIRQNSQTRTTCAQNSGDSDIASDSDRNTSADGNLTTSSPNSVPKMETSSDGSQSWDDGYPESVEGDFSFNLAESIIKGLTPPEGQPKSIPTVVLYDDKGLQIYDQITYLEEYYLVQEEIDILVSDSDRIVDHIPDNSVVVELGSGYDLILILKVNSD